MREPFYRASQTTYCVGPCAWLQCPSRTLCSAPCDMPSPVLSLKSCCRVNHIALKSSHAHGRDSQLIFCLNSRILSIFGTSPHPLFGQRRCEDLSQIPLLHNSPPPRLLYNGPGRIDE